MKKDNRVYYNELVQGTPEWFEIRAGCVTASELSSILAEGKLIKGGNGAREPSKMRRTYLLTLAGEIITGKPAESYSNHHMERGHEQEPEARAYYELRTNQEVEQCGFIKLGDHIGYSPDGLIGENGLLEAKSKLSKLQLDIILDDDLNILPDDKIEVPAEHVPQLQGGLWISGREWIDFISYSPGLPMIRKRVYRDEKYIKMLAEEVEVFLGQLFTLVEKIRAI